MVKDDSGRYDSIDLIKGIGIFLVVWGHAMEPRSVYLYSFHMPLFFFVSGYLHKDKPLKPYLLGRLNRLYVPYAAFSILSWLFYLVVLILRDRWEQVPAQLGRIYSVLTGLARNGGNDPIWFLTCLFVTGLLYLLVRRLKHGWMRMAAVAALAAAGYWLGLRRILLPWKIDAALSGLVFYALGHLAGEKGFFARFDKLNLLIWLACLAGGEAAHIAAAHANVAVSGIPKVAMISNNLGYYPLFLAAALAGTGVFTALCCRIKRLPVLNYLGIESLTILALHKPLLYLFRLATPHLDYGWPVYGLLAAVAATGLSAAMVPILKRYAPWLVGLKPLFPHR